MDLFHSNLSSIIVWCPVVGKQIGSVNLFLAAGSFAADRGQAEAKYVMCMC